MSDKAKPQPSAGKPAAKVAGRGAFSDTTDAISTSKSRPANPADESFDFLAPSQSKDELGRLAHYRILKVIGRGGMGIVFMAEDSRLHRIVGLKVMLPSMAKKKIAHDRFIREARATAAIEHDHIITIYEVNDDSNVPYLAMQYLKGATLEDFLKVGKSLNVPQIMRIGREIAKGLAAAHACKLIHRDIKPSNIWLDSTNKGRVKILDFGLARPTTGETHLTQEGMVLGSPAYMSPEQAFGHNVDERCDLFSLGCVLYRLCAGKLPFTGKDPISMLQAITSAEPTSLRELNAEVPRALADLIHQLLAKKPDDRPASAKLVVQRFQEMEREWIANSKTLAMPTVPVGQTSTATAVTAAKDHDVEPILEESAIMDLELHPTETPDIRLPRRGRSWLIPGLAGAVIAVISVMCCLGLAISSDHGFITIAGEDEAAKAFLDKSGLTLWDHHKKEHALKPGTHQLPTGGYHIEANELPEGMQAEPKTFSLHWRETIDVKVRFVTPKRIRPTLVPLKSEQARKIQKDWAVYVDQPIVEMNSVEMKLVLIPPGEFQMGSPKDIIKQALAEVNRKFKKKELPDQYLQHLVGESPRHTVRITRPFYLGECEVTFGQFTKFVAAENYVTIPERTRAGGTGIENGVNAGRKPGYTWKFPGFKQSADHPVCNLTWKDAEAFCAWLSKSEKKTYRLPTEAEWEYACRAGTTTLWHFGDDSRDAAASDHMWLPPAKATSLGASSAVRLKKANPFGLFDMHGNVEEMCADYWLAGFYDRSGVDDPKGPEPAGKNMMRVARGGSFLEIPFLGRSAYRNPLDPSLGYAQVGFRVVCEIPLPEE